MAVGDSFPRRRRSVLDALFGEARELERRRRRRYLLLALLACMVAAALVVMMDGRASPSASRGAVASLPAAATACNGAAAKPVLTAARGRDSAALYVSGTQVNVCISDGNPAATGSEGGAAELGLDAPGPDQLGLPGGGGGALRGFTLNGFTGANTDRRLPDQFQGILQDIPNLRLRAQREAAFRHLLAEGVERNLYGLAGDDIATVTFVFADGTTVDATVQNGWYFAWWSGLDQPNSVQVMTKSGKIINSQMAGPSCKPGSSDCVFAGLQPHPALAVPTPTTPASTAPAGVPTRTTATTSTPNPPSPITHP